MAFMCLHVRPVSSCMRGPGPGPGGLWWLMAYGRWADVGVGGAGHVACSPDTGQTHQPSGGNKVRTRILRKICVDLPCNNVLGKHNCNYTAFGAYKSTHVYLAYVHIYAMNFLLGIYMG